MRQGLAEGGKMGHLGPVPAGDQEPLVGPTSLALLHVVVLHQLAPASQDGVAGHQPGKNPLVVNCCPITSGHPPAVHEVWLKQLYNGL